MAGVSSKAISLVCILHAMTGVTDTLHAVVYAAMLGGLVRGVNPLSQVIWMKFPCGYAWKVIADGIASYAIAAVVIRMIG